MCLLFSFHIIFQLTKHTSEQKNKQLVGCEARGLSFSARPTPLELAIAKGRSVCLSVRLSVQR